MIRTCLYSNVYNHSGSKVVETLIQLIGLQLLIDSTVTTNTFILYYITFVFSQVAKYGIEKTTHHKHTISKNIKLNLQQADASNSKFLSK